MNCSIRNHFLSGVAIFLAFVLLPSAYAGSDWLVVEVEIDINDHVQVPVLNWLVSNRKYRTIDPDQGPNSNGDRIYRIEILGELGVVVDSTVARLTSSPTLIYPHSKNSKGKIPNRIKVVFPAVAGMRKIKITRGRKEIFESRLIDISAALEIDMLERHNYFGSNPIRAAVKDVSKGSSEALFRSLFKSSNECIAKNGEFVSDCQKIKLRAERNLKFTN